MFPYDMPQDIGSAQWNNWFARQPSLVKSQVVQAITSMTEDQSLPPSMTQGGYAPELSQSSADLLGMGTAPVEQNTKGQVQPYDLGVASTTTNVLQDRNSYLIDNAAAMQAGPGAYSAEAFDPVLTPIGSPLQAPGSQLLDRYAKSGGSSWQSYIADAILNRGLDPASAQADLIVFVQAPETKTATPEEQAQRKALIASLPGRAIKDELSGVYTMHAPDVKDIANTVDTDKIFDWADKGFQAMATDPMAGYTDPATNLDYAGAKAEDSTAAKWYHDRGLALPTDQYTDENFLQHIAPVDPMEVAAWNQSRSDTSSAADTALKDFQSRQSEYEKMKWTYDRPERQATQAGLFNDAAQGLRNPGGSIGGGGGGGGGRGLMGVSPRGDDQLPTTGLPWQPSSSTDIVAGQGGMRPPMASGGQPFTPFQSPSQLFGTDDWSVQSSPSAPSGPQMEGTVTRGASVPADTRGMSGLPSTVTREDLDAGRPTPVSQTTTYNDKGQRVSGGGSKSGKTAGPGFKAGSVSNDILQQAFARAEAARRANASAIQARSAAQEAPDAIFQQAMAYMAAKKLQDSGRTRLGDQLAQRALAARASGLYGYQ